MRVRKLFLLIFSFAVLLSCILTTSAEEADMQVWSRSTSGNFIDCNGKTFRYGASLVLTKEYAVYYMQTDGYNAPINYGDVLSVVEVKVYLPEEDVFVIKRLPGSASLSSRLVLTGEVQYNGEMMTGEIVSANAIMFLTKQHCIVGSLYLDTRE